MKPPKSTQEFVTLLKKENDLCIISEEIDPHLELAEIQRQAAKQKTKALLFTNVKGTRFPVATNLYGSEKRLSLAFGGHPEKVIKEIVALQEDLIPFSLKKAWQKRCLLKRLLRMGTSQTTKAPVFENKIAAPGLKALPQIKSWPEDGGAFITLPLVYTQSPHTHKNNLGMYRVQLHDEKTCGLHMQIHRGGGFHYHEAQQLNQALPAHIYIGGPPALTLAAIAPLPENVPELLFASLLLNEKIKQARAPQISQLPIIAHADFCIIGDIPPHKRKPEGPFGDHYGYYSLKHDYPFMEVSHVFHRNNAVFPATVVGKPPQEDHYITCYLQDIFNPLIKLVMPQVLDLWAYEESGVHTVASAIVKDRYPREALTTALRILGEGQLSLTKVLFLTDKNINIKNFKLFLPHVLERMDFEKDLFVIAPSSQDTLDYTGPKVNHGSKAIFLGVGGKKRALPEFFEGNLPQPFSEPHVFCPGVLAITGPAFSEDKSFFNNLSHEESLKNWSLIFIFDDAQKATDTTEGFLWHAFTRFEPASDFYAKDIALQRFHPEITTPLIIDCRLKPWYPKTLESNPEIMQKAERLLNKKLN
ncbi:UbiD family decarboxylase [bacterium]|nr:UbiD family decarboxylase [bacterium]MBU1916752.1 UbiD family decarboxylase [bacterium]